MKSFNEFIGESRRDWLENTYAGYILSEEQCQYIEDILGSEIDFINNQENPEEYSMFYQLTEGTLLISRDLGDGSIINRYEIITGLDILYMRPSNPMDSDRWIIIKESDRIVLNQSNGNLDDWKIESLFSDF
jgi:hypothetical protein